MGEVTVTQADMNEAANLLDELGGIQRFEKIGISFAKMNNAFCQAFARHRIAALEEAAKVAEAHREPHHQGDAWWKGWDAACQHLAALYREEESPTTAIRAVLDHIKETGRG